MDTSSKERLVGAIIFVVLIVLLVPEILSGPHHTAAANGALPAGQTRSYIIDLGNPTKPSSTQPLDPKPATAPPAAGAQKLPPAVASESKPAADPAPATQPEPAVPPKLAAATPAASVKPTPTPVATTPAPGPPKGANEKAGFVAQLGSFSRAENAQRLVTTLRAKGYRAFVSPTGAGSHVLHRVRVGPESSRDAAEALVARLKKDGQTASIVSLP